MEAEHNNNNFQSSAQYLQLPKIEKVLPNSKRQNKRYFAEEPKTPSFSQNPNFWYSQTFTLLIIRPTQKNLSELMRKECFINQR